MRRLLLGAAILVLVSVYWFRPMVAQTLTDAQLQRLKDNPELYQQYLQREQQLGSKRYTTPPIYGDARVGSLEGLNNSARQNSSSTALQNHFAAREAERDFRYDALLDELERTNKQRDKTLRPFGLDMFRQTSELPAPIEIPSAEDYLLGPGDNLLIYLWGRVEREFNLTIDRQGKLFVPTIGEIVAWGQKLDQFEENLHAKFKEVYSDFEMNVTLGKIRSIRIYVIGEVQRPGAYTVSALTTFFNALSQAGGPTDRGSLRKLRVVRAGKILREIDLYDFLITGDNSVDVRLRSGDAIFVPVVEAQVHISGEVKRRAIYELKGGETALDALLLAGGRTSAGYLRKVFVMRITNMSETELVDVNLDQNTSGYNSTFKILDGDHMTVRSIYDAHRNYVAIGGMVKHPGRYERTDSMMLSDIVKLAELQPDDVFYERVNLFRTHTDNRREMIAVSLADLINEETRELHDLTITDRDSIHVYSVDELERSKHVKIDGEVKFPGEYELYEGMTVSDLVFLSGNPKRSAFLERAEIARTDDSGNVTLRFLDLTNPLMSQMKLAEDDRVYIRQIPEWDLQRQVILEGEALFPGIYTLVDRGESLWALLKRAGGFTIEAFPVGLVLERTSISQSVYQRNIDRIVSSSLELREDSLGRIREVEHVRYDASTLNRIIVDMPRIIASHGGEGDVTLQPGDRIYVPQIPPGISVLGAVGASGTIKFEIDKKSKYYLERAGGFTKQADKGGLKLVKADGRVFSGSDAKKQVVQLGDAIVVPSEIKKDRDFMKSFTSMVSIISGLATSAFILTKL